MPKILTRKEPIYAIIIMIVILVAGCDTETSSARLDRLEMRGWHELDRMTIYKGFSGNISGNVGFFTSGIDGQIDSQHAVLFVWKYAVGVRRYFKQIPVCKIEIILDETCEIPVIQFNFRVPSSDAIFNPRQWNSAIDINQHPTFIDSARIKINRLDLESKLYLIFI